MKTAWDNKDNLSYAYRILTQGVCDGCALGVSGLRDQTLAGPHLCTTRLNVLRLNTMPAIEDKWLSADIEQLRKLDSTELRKLGRIPYPLSRKKGERSFSRISWDEALSRIADKIKSIDKRQLAFYLTARVLRMRYTIQPQKRLGLSAQTTLTTPRGSATRQAKRL